MAHLTNILHLRWWQSAQIKKEKAAGEAMFCGFPEKWLNDPTWFCINGHVSGRFLGDEHHDLCLACAEIVILGPPEIGEKAFGAILPTLRVIRVFVVSSNKSLDGLPLSLSGSTADSLTSEPQG